MNAASLEALLAALGRDTEDATAAYRMLHARLVRFFDLQNITDPEALADQAMDRLAASLLARGTETIASPAAFVLGIARHLLQEERRHVAREGEVAYEWARGQIEDSATKETELQRLERCLEQMPKDRRELLRSYYAWSGRAKIEHHRRMAAEHGLSVNALRNRMLRARAELLACLKQQRDVSAGSDTLYKARKYGKEDRERAIP
jgi:DNA-directed RNA polymerase specialized sigma24 family protein